MKEDKRGSMYATKRKLHNLLQAATGGGSTTAGTGSADKESTASTVSKTLSRFRSKSTANLPKPSPKEGESDEDATVLRPPRTAGGHETTASASQIELVLAGAGVTGTSIVGASTSAEDLADEELRKKRNKVTVAPVSLSLLEKDRFSLSIRPSSPSAGSPIGSIPSRASTIHVSEKPTPAYAPWDRAQFLDRLRTYRFVDKWSVKPPAVNEVEWSRRGWVCVDKNRVRCTVCAKEVVVKVDADGDEMDGMEVEGMEERINERETSEFFYSLSGSYSIRC